MLRYLLSFLLSLFTLMHFSYHRLDNISCTLLSLKTYFTFRFSTLTTQSKLKQVFHIQIEQASFLKLWVLNNVCPDLSWIYPCSCRE